MTASPASRLGTPAALLVLCAGLACILLYAAHDVFDADELQHAHLAWLVAGGKVLYRDVWDNHGPLFALMNGGLLALTDAAPGTGVIYACRAGAVAASTGILACTVGISRRLGLSWAVALAAAGLTAMLVFVQDKGAECRPDGLQNLFWLAGLLVMLGVRRGVGRPLAAGALFGLAVLTNVKAALGPAVLGVFLLLGRRLHGLAPRVVASELGALAGGALLAYLPVLAYFAAAGAALALHDYSAYWNLLYMDGGEAGRLSRANVAFLVERQLPFLLLAAGGVVAWIADLRAPAGALGRPGGWLVLAAAVGTGFALALDFYSQFFLVFLPLWAIVAAFGLMRLGQWSGARLGAAGGLATGAIVAAGLAGLVAGSWPLVPRADRPQLRFQESFTRMLLQATPRTEPVGVIWDFCGGFMFNEPLQFYWGAEPAIGATAQRHGGRDPFAEDFVAALERGRVRYVVGRDDQIFPALPAVTQRYLRERYSYANCLWTRRRGPASGGVP